ERDAGSEKRVRGVLDHLRGMQVGDQDLRLEFAVDGGDRCGRRLMMRPEHKAVRMHEVLDRAALTQKLGVRDHMKLSLLLEGLADDAGDNVAVADWHRD